jgi:3-deoxy-7-phosphoheptulonate synthase
LTTSVIVDCSHGNSAKNHKRQEIVWRNVIEQRLAENNSLVGVMLESYIREGKQVVSNNTKNLQYGLSVTDACIGWQQTAKILRQTYIALHQNQPINKITFVNPVVANLSNSITRKAIRIM